ncbi:hypothetical protein NQ314_015833 [Rhamnusium bicolor]|uniref:Chitin-binding type-2 domain-containing protein n=1 Tax=Rhamnusium bicolor TaxID=1586634 RepID=A0AAV8WYC0_9CUCU|nr:hypothetical protein NQ314_015833 [Rhamnusium bicolor]
MATTPPQSCGGPGKYPATNCNQYYECVEVMYWYELVVQNCGSGQSFSNTAQGCIADSSCNP